MYALLCKLLYWGEGVVYVTFSLRIWKDLIQSHILWFPFTCLCVREQMLGYLIR